jgi:hypothetical protein
MAGKQTSINEQSMTKDEAQLFKARWQMVNEITDEEARRASLATRLNQLALLFAAGHALGWREKRDDSQAEVRERWLRLKAKAHG